jgi:hypothetical protein
MGSVEINSRADLAEALSARMAATYASLREEGELEPDTSLVKTYLLEAHVPEGEDGSAAHSVLEQAFGRELGRAQSRSVRRAEDPTLGVAEFNFQGERVSLFVDYSNPRFWLAHSMSGSSALDYVVGAAVRRTPALDRAWLPADLLAQASTLGALRGLGLDYDRRRLPDVDLESEEAPVAFMKMQLWGNTADGVLNLLREHFPHETTLAKIKLRYQLRSTDDEFSIDDIKFDGKVTARGNSFDTHTALITAVYRTYAAEIRRVEEQYALRTMETNGHIAFAGTPISFHFERPIADLARFCQLLFSSAEPFRLWGSPLLLSERFVRVDAVDLHVGCALTLELSPDWIRIYVPEGACGNSVLRIYTNLQHYYDSRVRAVNADGEPYFGFQPQDVEPVDRSR